MDANDKSALKMAPNKGEEFSRRDIFLDYPFEEVMFRWDHRTEEIHKKFYGKQESLEVVHYSNRLFNEAILSGHEITREQYLNGKIS